MKHLGLIIFSTIMLFACKKEEEQELVSDQQVQEANVIVLNEGNFQWGNGSVSLYNEQSKNVENKVFQKNNDFIIGDVVQSMVQIGDLGYIVINNSNKIRVVNLNTFKSAGAIENLNSPRYILPINNQKAYVSDLYEDKLYVVDLAARSIIKTIPTKGWTEEMALVGNRAFVSQVDSSQILVFDTRNDSLLKKISTNASPQHIEVDNNQGVWVSCNGGSTDTAAIIKIDPSNMDVEKVYAESSLDNSIGEIEFNYQKNVLLYMTNQGVKRYVLGSTSLPTSTWIATEGRNLYGLSVNPDNGDVYLCDAVDYQQHGTVYRYSSQRVLIDQFKVGIIPGDVYFKK